MLTKIVLRKTTSAIFLAIVLVLGTITLMHPSFIVGAQAESDDDNESDNNLIRMEDNDDESSDDEEEAKDNGDESDNDESVKDNNSNNEIKEVSYDSDNNNYYKSKDSSSSSSVFVKKIKCNNINVNLNGVDVDLGLSPGNGPVNGPIAEAQALDDESSNSFVSNGEIRQSDSGTDSRIVCINNNNNVVVGEELPEPETCEDCFTENLTPDEIEILLEILQPQVSSLEQICNILLTGGAEEQIFRILITQTGASPDDVDALIECLEDVGVIFEVEPPLT
jgi:hypothetical protein